MKPKKIIAREFLYFIGTLLLLAILNGCFLLYNVYQENRINKISNDISLLNNQYQTFLSRPLKFKNKDITQEKLDDFVNFITENPNATTKYVYELIPELNNDSILLKGLADYAATSASHKYKYKKEQNIKFPEFFIIEQTDINSIEYYQSKIELIKNEEAKAKGDILSTSETINYMLTIAFWVFILTFVFRYLVYATKWSIRTIKSKD